MPMSLTGPASILPPTTFLGYTSNVSHAPNTLQHVRESEILKISPSTPSTGERDKSLCDDALNITVISRERTGHLNQAEMGRGEYALITRSAGYVDSFSLLRQKVQMIKGVKNLP